MPAIYDLANRGLLPPGFSLVGFARRRLGRRGLRPDRARLGQDPRPHRVPRGGVAAARRGVPVRPRQLRRRRGLRPAAPYDRGARRGPRHRRQPRVLPGDPARRLRHGRRTAPGARPGRGRRRRLATGRRREALRARPGVGPRAQRHPRRGLPVRLDLPHRPLPRQGDGPEHLGDPVRQRDVRADLELPLRRPRADHHGRGRRHRRPRRLLRRHRRRARRHPEPPDAADVAGRDGGAGVVRRRRAAHREAEGALQRHAAAGVST